MRPLEFHHDDPLRRARAAAVCSTSERDPRTLVVERSPTAASASGSGSSCRGSLEV